MMFDNSYADCQRQQSSDPVRTSFKYSRAVFCSQVRYPKRRNIPMQMAMMIRGNKKNCAIRSEVGFLTSIRSSTGGTGTLVLFVSIREQRRIWERKRGN